MLPWFGGGAAVWTTCLLFFQIVLLAGYAYAHLIGRLPIRVQLGVHLVVLAASMALLPIVPDAAWKPGAGDQPALRIIALLVATVGLPCVVLSATSPLVQSWFGRAETASPYPLYAVSNLGSLLGLLTYPFLIEPLLGLGLQARVWSIGYVVFGAALAWAAVVVFRRSSGEPAERHPVDPPERRAGVTALYVILPAFGVILLLSISAQLTVNIAPVPLLWVVPLALYLLSYIVVFTNDAWYRRRLWTGLFCVAVVPALWVPVVWRAIGLWPLVAIYSTALFAGCMVCHGELVRLRPRSVDLTRFYLLAATGGALGGAFVSIVAPLVFTRYWELDIGLAGVFALIGVCRSYAPARAGDAGANLVQAAGMRRSFMLVWSLAAAGIFALGALPFRSESHYIASSRSFYGRVSVGEIVDEGRRVRALIHGRVHHGAQIMDGRSRREPTLYFRAESGVGRLFAAFDPGAGRRVGVLGLGAGTLAAHGRAGDTIRFYELDPTVERMARRYFTYLADTPAEVSVVIGDARISLERELADGSRNYDILVLDAFTGGAVPVHLMTREAFELYAAHLARDGAIAINITNAYLDLSALSRNLARSVGMESIMITSDPDERWRAGSTWVLARRGGFGDMPELEAAATPWPDHASDIIWTDDYSNLFRLLE